MVTSSGPSSSRSLVSQLGLGLEGDGTWGTLKQTKNQTKNLPTQVSNFNPITLGDQLQCKYMCQPTDYLYGRKTRSKEQIFMFYVWDETAKQEQQEQSAYS